MDVAHISRPNMIEGHWSACLLHEDADKISDIYRQLRCTMDERIDDLRCRYSHSKISEVGLFSLAQTLFDRFSLFGNTSLLEESIAAYRTLVLVESDPLQSSAILDGLGEALCERFTLFSAPDDITEALRLHEQSLQLCNDNSLNGCRSTMGIAWAHFTRAIPASDARCVEDRKRSRKLLEATIHLLPSNSPYRTCAISKLCRVVSYSFDDFDGDEIRDLILEASNLAHPGHPDHPQLLISAGAVLTDSGLYHDATTVQRKTIRNLLCYVRNLTVDIDHPWWPIAARANSIALVAECDKFGDTTFVEEALSITQVFWESCSPQSVYFWLASTLRVAAFSSAYWLTGELNFLDESINVGRRAMTEDLPRIPPYTPLVHNLSHCLQTRYELVGREEDLGDALRLSEECLPHDFGPVIAETSRFVGLAAALRLLRYRRLGHMADLDKGLELYRRCLPILGELYLEAAITLVGPAVEALCTRFETTKDILDLEEALDLVRNTLGRADNTSLRFELLHLMCKPLRILAQYGNDQLLAELAVTAGDEVLSACPYEHAEYTECLAGVAQNYLVLWSVTGDYESLRKGSAYFSQAVSVRYASPHVRLKHAITWTRCMTKTDSEMLLEAYRQAVSLLPRVTHFAGNWKSRLLALQQAPGLACDAAMHALALGHVGQALELLEQGRAVFWNQALSGAARWLDGLPSHLAERLTSVASGLELDAACEHNLSRTQKLADELDSLIAAARTVPGHEYFLASKPAEKLCAAARSGPIVILVANSSGAAAIILRSGHSPLHVPFPSFTVENIDGLAHSLRSENGYRRQASAGGEVRKIISVKRRPKRDAYTDILEKLWRHVGRPIVDALGLKRDNTQSRPRIFWCCTGHFFSLPMHAMGSYQAGTPEYMSDYAISSYVPTVTALWKADGQPPAGPLCEENGSVMAVAEANAPGCEPLPETLEEMKRVRNLLPPSTLAQDFPAGSAHIQYLLDTLPKTSVLHLACHGKQDMQAALNSGFVLRDGILTLSMIMAAHTPKANFAFLSACESAMGDEKTPDEAIHLAAAMMFIGFRTVVATLWSMHDADGPRVAEHVYRELLESKCDTFDYDAVPRALDAAVREMRDEGVHPSRWATWIHMGI